MDLGDHGTLREVVRNAIYFSQTRHRDAGKMANALNGLVEDLSRQKKLDNLLLGLEDAERSAPAGSPIQRPVTADLERFVTNRGTAAAKKAYGEDSILAKNPTAGALVRDLTEATNLGSEDLVALHASRITEAFRAATTPEQERKLGATLDETVKTLARKGTLDDVQEALERHAENFISSHPNVRYYPIHRQIRDLLEGHATPEARKAWDDAAKRRADSGPEIGTRLAEAVDRSADAEANALARRSSLLRDDSGKVDPAKARALNDTVTRLARTGKLEDLVRALDRHDQDAMAALLRRNPGIRIRPYPAKNQVGNALEEAGTPEAKAAWSKAVRAAGTPTGQEVAADIAAAIRGGEDRQATDDTARIASPLALPRTAGPVNPEDVAVLNSAVLSLARQGSLGDLVKTLRRTDDRLFRDNPNARIIGNLHLLSLAVERHGTPAARRALERAIRTP
jgi:hypothetical protein